MWEIYSIGDAAFLERVLNALAMIAGTGSLEKVAGIGMLVGLIILGFQSILGGGTGIKFQNLLVSWILYSLMFGTGARVAIEDVYSGQVRVVDNVPYGVAAAGSMVSQLGYGVTSVFEQAFGEAQMTEHGFAFALETLANLRKMALTKAGLGDANSPANGDDFWQSWRNYIADCTMTGVNLKQYSIEDIQKSRRGGGGAGILEQLKFDSQSYGTEIHIQGAANNGFQTCTDAYVSLSTHTTSSFVPALKKRAAEQFGLSSMDDVDARIQQAFLAMEQSSVDAQNYMLTTAMAPIFDWGQIDNEINFQRTSIATMLHTALQQRNEQWAAEQALFNTVVRPMMTFFEGLVYAITPMMAFLIGLGPMGIQLMGKYLMILLWIQLWMPVLSIINLYLHMAVGKKMVALQAPSQGNLPLDSFYGLHSLDQTLQTWMATGGMLASSVPAITLMLIYGGAVTASSVASRMSSGNVPADVSTPSMSSNGPLLERSSMRQSTDASGLSTTGSQGIGMQVNGGYTSALASSKDEVSTRQAAYAQQLSSQLSRGNQSTEQVVEGVRSGISQTSQDSEGYKAALQHGRNLVEGTSWGSKLNDQTLATIGASSMMGAGVNARAQYTRGPSNGKDEEEGKENENNSKNSRGGFGWGLGVDAKAGGQLASQIARSTGLTADQGRELAERMSAGTNKTRESGAAFLNAVAKENSSSDQNTFARSMGFTENEALTKSASELTSASSRFAASEQLQRSMGINNNMTDNRIAPELRNRGLDGDVKQFMASYGALGGKDSLNNRAGDFFDLIKGKNPGMKDEDAQLAASAFAIADGRFLDGIAPEQREGIAIQGAQLMSRIAGLDTPNQTAHSASQGVGANADRVASGTTNKVESGVQSTGLTADGVRSNVDQGMQNGRETIAGTSPRDHYDQAQQNVDARAGGYDSQYAGDRAGQIRDRVTQTAEANAQARESLGMTQAMLGGATPTTLQENGLMHILQGNSNLEGFLAQQGLESGKDAEEFLNMSAEQRQAVAEDTQNRLANAFMAKGMHEDVANYTAGLMLPEAMTHMYSDSGWMAKVGLADSQESQVRSAAFDASSDQRREGHDTLWEGLQNATGDNAAANIAMQDMAHNAVAMANLKNDDGAEMLAARTQHTMAAVGYEGNELGGAFASPAPAQPASNNDQAVEDYLTPSTPQPSPSESTNPVIR